MNIGWIGLGKLGLPCALVLAQHHQVYGYDRSDLPWKITYGQEQPMREAGIGALLDDPDHSHRIHRCDSVAEVVREAVTIFVAVQTPHAPGYGGERPMLEDRKDFDYSALVQVCREVCRAAQHQNKDIVLVVVSTVLPGTTNRLIRPLLNSHVHLIYSPQFIAMGTTIYDFLNPEFVICGADDTELARDVMLPVFQPVHKADKLYLTDITSAEMIKVTYNTFISMKIVFANMVMELCEKTGADCGEVVEALALAKDRVISAKYLSGGMGDGGACHPRDLIAMSWLAQRTDLSYDLLGELAFARECQTEWVADVVRAQQDLTGYQVAILGESYKPGSDLTAGSPALLLRHYLEDLKPTQFDPHTWTADGSAVRFPDEPGDPLVYVIATRHQEFITQDFRPGSVVIDPFGYIPDKPGITVVRLGRRW